jgi:hypothetical protein
VAMEEAGAVAVRSEQESVIAAKEQRRQMLVDPNECGSSSTSAGLPAVDAATAVWPALAATAPSERGNKRSWLQYCWYIAAKS